MVDQILRQIRRIDMGYMCVAIAIIWTLAGHYREGFLLMAITYWGDPRGRS